VANSRQVSLVERSPSTVTRLKVAWVKRETRACRAAGAIAASVTMKLSMVAIVRGDHPRSLGDPGRLETVTPVDLGLGVGALWKGVGGHDRRRGGGQLSARRPRRSRPAGR